MRNRKSLILISTIMLVCIFVQPALAAEEASMMAYAESYGILTLLPPAMAILLALLTKNVILSLGAGAFTGAFLLTFGGGNVFKATYDSFFKFTGTILDSVTDPWNAGILLQCLAIMALVAVVSRMGGIRAIANVLSKYAKTGKSAGIITWVMGLLIFFDDYANAMIVGPVMRPILDGKRISREKQAFIVDATAAPIAGLALISTWIAAELGSIKQGFDNAGIIAEPYAFFLDTIPFRFYNVLMLVFVFLSVYWMRDFGKMYKAEYRSRKFGKVLADDARPMVSSESLNYEPDDISRCSVWDAIIPIGTLIVGAIVGFISNGRSAILSGSDAALIELVNNNLFSFAGLRECVSYADASIVLFEVSIFAAVVAAIMALVRKKLTLNEFTDTWVEGLKAVLMACVILVLAWTLSTFVKELGTRYFLADLIGSWMPAFLLPTVIFVFGSVISFATGTSYGTMGILMPLAIPLAFDMRADMGFVTVVAGAVLTGAIFGDHCSPISDTTILSSAGTACDHIHHVETQLQYALVVGGIAILFGFLPAGFGVNPWILLALGIAAVVITLRVFGKNPEIEISKEK